MSKYNRYQTTINRNADDYVSEDHWLKQFEKTLEKGAVQPRSQNSLFEQINSVMNGNMRSKYPSVQAAVEDMMQRSGLTSYLKVSENNEDSKVKTAQGKTSDAQSNMPDIITNNPMILKTLENYIRSSRGNLPVPAIIDKIRSIHHNDVGDDKLWEDDRLIRLVSRLNLEAKKNNPSNYQDYTNLAVSDRGNSDSDIDPSNTDAFNALTPAKM